MDLLSHPFRVGDGGRLATVPDGSDEANAEAIAGIVLTRPGERELVPDYGITDPAFTGIDVAQVNAVLYRHGPDVRVTGADVTYLDDTTARTVLEFEEV